MRSKEKKIDIYSLKREKKAEQQQIYKIITITVDVEELEKCDTNAWKWRWKITDRRASYSNDESAMLVFILCFYAFTIFIISVEFEIYYWLC